MNRIPAALLGMIFSFSAIAAEPSIESKESTQLSAEVDLRTIPFTLPDTVITSVEKIASECDLLTLGEVHGTQEVPLIALALMTPLSKLGYGALALEIPHDQHASITKWATGKTEQVPEFFSKPMTDGRGNVQVLSLIRIAASPPFGWKIICFDQSMLDAQRDFEEFERKSREKGKTSQAPGSETIDDDILLLWQKRDATMARNLAGQLKELEPQPKVLAICGNVHSRIEKNEKIPELGRLWPSFAGLLQRDYPEWKLVSMNVAFQSGGFFNGGKVQKFRGPQIEHPELSRASDCGYHWELKLPHATPATFLAMPSDVQ